ncbi:MAG: hypothetical protein HZA46_17385 [Planctomycetales bacterium]|nr:hypothetical protein [Planctomycetales bacterium]
MIEQLFYRFEMGRYCVSSFLLGLTATLVLAGCGGPKVISASGNPEEAKKVLSTALDAWKSGQKSDQLQSGKPVVYVADEDWRAGATLKAYQLSGAPEQRGGHWRVSAVLTVAAVGKPEAQKPVAFAVTMGSSINITRVDDVEAETDGVATSSGGVKTRADDD